MCVCTCSAIMHIWDLQSKCVYMHMGITTEQAISKCVHVHVHVGLIYTDGIYKVNVCICIWDHLQWRP